MYAPYYCYIFSTTRLAFLNGCSYSNFICCARFKWFVKLIIYCSCLILHDYADYSHSILVRCDISTLCSTVHTRSPCRKFPGQRDRGRRCEFVAWRDGGWRGSGGFPGDDGKPAAGSGDTAGERGISDGHQQTTPNSSGEDVSGPQRHHQSGTDQWHQCTILHMYKAKLYTTHTEQTNINKLLLRCLWLFFWWGRTEKLT